MSDYITNSKNRKLKTKILLFLSRINIGAGKLPPSGRIIIFMECVLFVSILFPWFHFADMNGVITSYSAFSLYSLFIGYLILVMITVTPFFLLSHTKKEYIRAIVPFRLSDTQAVVFITSIVFSTLINLILLNNIYNKQIAVQGANLGIGYKIAFSSVICILISAYFLSQSNKAINTDICYIDHQSDDELLEYRRILASDDEKNKKNMSLPI